jgi:hypothetical protein
LNSNVEEFILAPPQWASNLQAGAGEWRLQARNLRRECIVYLDALYEKSGRFGKIKDADGTMWAIDELGPALGASSRQEFLDSPTSTRLSVSSQLVTNRTTYTMYLHDWVIKGAVERMDPTIRVLGKGEQVLLRKPKGSPQEPIHVDTVNPWDVQVLYPACASTFLLQSMNEHLSASGLEPIPLRYTQGDGLLNGETTSEAPEDECEHGTLCWEWSPEQLPSLGDRVVVARVLESIRYSSCVSPRICGSAASAARLLLGVQENKAMDAYYEALCPNFADPDVDLERQNKGLKRTARE